MISRPGIEVTKSNTNKQNRQTRQTDKTDRQTDTNTQSNALMSVPEPQSQSVTTYTHACGLPWFTSVPTFYSYFYFLLFHDATLHNWEHNLLPLDAHARLHSLSAHVRSTKRPLPTKNFKIKSRVTYTRL